MTIELKLFVLKMSLEFIHDLSLSSGSKLAHSMHLLLHMIVVYQTGPTLIILAISFVI